MGGVQAFSLLLWEKMGPTQLLLKSMQWWPGILWKDFLGCVLEMGFKAWPFSSAPWLAFWVIGVILNLCWCEERRITPASQHEHTMRSYQLSSLCGGVLFPPISSVPHILQALLLYMKNRSFQMAPVGAIQFVVKMGQWLLEIQNEGEKQLQNCYFLWAGCTCL